MVAFPERGLLLTASPDGCVLLSSLALVLGGSLVEAGLSLPGTASAGGNAAPQGEVVRGAALAAGWGSRVPGTANAGGNAMPQGNLPCCFRLGGTHPLQKAHKKHALDTRPPDVRVGCPCGALGYQGGDVSLAPTVLVPVDRLSASVNRLVDLASMLGKP